MKKILLSVFTAFVAVVVVAGATAAVFSSTATVEDNTFATGELEIRINGSSSITGFTFGNAAPGDCISGQFGVNNYGLPWFVGPSTLDAKELVISSANATGDTDLYDALEVTIEANRGWPTRMAVYSGALNGAFEEDLLSPRWTELIPGSSEDVYYNVCLPITAGDDLQGKSTTFDFVVDAYNPVRP